MGAVRARDNGLRTSTNDLIVFECAHGLWALRKWRVCDCRHPLNTNPPDYDCDDGKHSVVSAAHTQHTNEQRALQIDSHINRKRGPKVFRRSVHRLNAICLIWIDKRLMVCTELVHNRICACRAGRIIRTQPTEPRTKQQKK